jgi:alkanesulfonate monooxygenase SsuD/methylene tetrahydromethanopterin reductase-like flavin-dependent oxidoreductase (luciferase family)
LDGAFDSNCSWPIAEAGVRIAERGKFDLFFIADSLVSAANDHPSLQTRLEPTTTVAALSLVAHRIGFGCTVSTSFSEPFNVARVFQSLAHLTKGRIAWNIVTSNSPDAHLNFSRESHVEHDRRYEIAGEFVDVVRGLWRGWDKGAVVRDRKTGVFIDRTKVRALDHKGRYFQVRGPLNIERPLNGEPLLIQAGGSEAGQELSARTADIVFSVVNGDKEEAKTAYDGLKARMAKYGREPDELVLFAGRHADHRPHGKRSQGPARPATELGIANQRPAPRVRPHRPRHLWISTRRAGARSSTDAEQSVLCARTALDGAASEHDVARPLQYYRRCPRPLGDLGHADAHCRHAAGVVRGWAG